MGLAAAGVVATYPAGGFGDDSQAPRGCLRRWQPPPALQTPPRPPRLRPHAEGQVPPLRWVSPRTATVTKNTIATTSAWPEMGGQQIPSHQHQLHRKPPAASCAPGVFPEAAHSATNSRTSFPAFLRLYIFLPFTII
ncbi:hypothetical protein Vafri_3171 [Volvox africanus]|uniref:Uncharacterized protein n=1 Tax=Volvox africanus TaxID=51714 RepID=A0A8J4ASY1_9CHLO|nr:hypothetical protein Vafri_3171 [Volvox africanus]